MRNLALILLLAWFSRQSSAAEFTSATAAGIYRDQLIETETYSQQVTASSSNEQGHVSRVGLGATQNREHLGKAAEPKKVDLGPEGHREILSTSISFGQTIAYLHTLQLFYDQSSGNDSSSHALGVGYEGWAIKDRFRLGLFYQQNKMEQQAKDFTDIDGKRVVTPERIDGKNYRLETMSYLQPTTILLAGYSVTRREDRPDAWALSLQLRQYINDANGALHMTYQRYENVGSIEANTEIGEVVADRYAVEWHQKFAKQYIALLGYRASKEIEKPRAYESGYKQNGSDYIYTSVRYRASASWTFRSNEFSALYGRYIRNDGLSGYLLGVGLDFIL